MQRKEFNRNYHSKCEDGAKYNDNENEMENEGRLIK